jgi:hypothetical protein
MLNTTEWYGVLPKLDNGLLLDQEQLAQLLAACVCGQEHKWVGVLQSTLSRTEQTLRQRLARCEAPEKPRAAHGQVQATLDRQQAQLCERYRDLLERCQALEGEVDCVSPVAAESADGPCAGNVDWDGLRHRAELFLTGLQETTEMEMKLVHETINTDIGAGD